jgi:hypothetical protein
VLDDWPAVAAPHHAGADELLVAEQAPGVVDVGLDQHRLAVGVDLGRDES